uniref:Neuroguidin n=1 Tax=Panagrolaimus davidi TaxID=227884 RepID=A0A914PH69_9BILA
MDDNNAYSKIVSECLKTSSESLAEIKKFKDFVKETSLKAKDGISFFDVKNHEMLSYLTDLSYLMAKMSVGESIENDSSIDRLIKLRVILEKMKPIESKLRPQVDRLIGAKSAKTGEVLSRARPDQFIVDDNEDGETEDDDEEEKKPKKYVPPKIHAVQYEGDEQEKEIKRLDRAKKRAIQSSLVRDLHAQYSEAPEEIFDESRAKESRTEKERRQYEEANFVRLQCWGWWK